MKEKLNKIGKTLNNIVKHDNDEAGNCHVVLTQPKVDKITVNFNVTDETHMHHVIDTCYGLKEFPVPGVFRVPGKGYKVTLKVYLPSEQGSLAGKDFILAQFAPFNKSAAFVRMEFNPSKINPGLYFALEKFFFDWLEINLPEELAKAWVTRLDVCMEMLNLEMDDVFIRAAKKRAASVFFGANGKTETIYLGKSSGNQIKLYNKAKELKKAGKHIRIEATLKKKTMMKYLQDIQNPFLTVEMFDLSCQLPGAEMIAFNLFKDSCRYRGIKNALKLLPETYRKKYGKLISENAAPWWKPKEFWGEHWTDALEAAQLLPEQCMSPKFILKKE